MTFVRPDGTEFTSTAQGLTNNMLATPLKIKEPDFLFEGIAECGGFDADGNPMPPPSAPPGTQLKNGRWVWDPPLSAMAGVNRGTDCSECAVDVYQPVCMTNARGTTTTVLSACMANCLGGKSWTKGACKKDAMPSQPGDPSFDLDRGLPDPRLKDPKFGKNLPF